MDDEDHDRDHGFQLGSANIFADLGLENADELLLKTDLAIAAVLEIEQRGWDSRQAADRMGLTEPEAGLLMRLKLNCFSQARLQTIVRRLGFDVTVRLERRREGGIGTLFVSRD